jgi:metal transporter CNNM
MKDLLLNDPADKVPLRVVVQYYKHPVITCCDEDKLDDMLYKFSKGRSHLAFVYDSEPVKVTSDDQLECVGILTLENVIEKLMQSDIKDEADFRREKQAAKSLFKFFSQINAELLFNFYFFFNREKDCWKVTW